jgi:hypothetical protein
MYCQYLLGMVLNLANAVAAVRELAKGAACTKAFVDV